MADRVDAVLADMDMQNRALGVAVDAAEVSIKRTPEMPVLDERPPVHGHSLQPEGDGSSQVLSISVGIGPQVSATTTPKAALRKRLLDARQALGGVKLGDAPKRSISFHPHFRRGVCDDDLV